MVLVGIVMKILFVCTDNVDRSKTAEEMFKNVEDVEEGLQAPALRPRFHYQGN